MFPPDIAPAHPSITHPLPPIRTSRPIFPLPLLDHSSPTASLHAPPHIDGGTSTLVDVHPHSSPRKSKNLSCGSPFSSDASVRRRFFQAIASSLSGGAGDCEDYGTVVSAAECGGGGWSDSSSSSSSSCARYSSCHDNPIHTVEYEEQLGNTRRDAPVPTKTASQHGRIRLYRYFVDSFICQTSRNAIKTLVFCFCYAPRSSARQNRLRCTSNRSMPGYPPTNYTVFPAWSNTPTKLSAATSLHCNMYGSTNITAPNGIPSTPLQDGALPSPQGIHQRAGMSPRPKSPGSVSWQSLLINSPRSQMHMRSRSSIVCKSAGTTVPVPRLGEKTQKHYHDDQLDEPRSPKVTCIGKVHSDFGCKKHKNVDRHEPHLIHKGRISQVKDKPKKRYSSNPIASAETFDRIRSNRNEAEPVPKQRPSSTTSVNVCPQRFGRAKQHTVHKICDFNDTRDAGGASTDLKNLHPTISSAHLIHDGKPACRRSIVNKLEAI